MLSLPTKENDMDIKDSGTRRAFESGAVRDIAEGKGRCDLLPLDVISILLRDARLRHLYDYIHTGNKGSLRQIISEFSIEYFGNLYTSMLEVAKHYEDGCRKYGERNWEKGIPLHCYIDSGVRHYLKLRRGDTDEAHDRAFLWNILGALWTHENRPELIDLPFGENDNKIEE